MAYQKVKNSKTVLDELDAICENNPDCEVSMYVDLTIHREIIIAKRPESSCFYVIDKLSISAYPTTNIVRSVYGKYFDLYEIEMRNKSSAD